MPLLGRSAGRATASDAEAQPFDEMQIREGLLRGALPLVPMLASMHIVAAVLFAWLFWLLLPHWLLAILISVLVATLGSTYGFGRQWMARLKSLPPGVAATQVAARRMFVVYARLACLQSVLIGSMWGIVLAAAFRVGDTPHRMIIVGVTAALMSNSFVVGALVWVATLYLVPLLAGSMLSLLFCREPICHVAAAQLTAYAIYVAFNIRAIHLRAVNSSRGKLRVQQQHETIGLLLRDFEENASDWLWETDASFRLRHVSARFGAASSVALPLLEGRDLATLVSGDHALAAALRDAVAARLPFRDLLVRTGGEVPARWWQLTGKPVVTADGVLVGWRGIGSDVTAAQMSKAEIARLAAQDALTGLANRATFNGALEIACLQALSSGEDLALFHADLDGFKEVNEQFGRHAADQLLVQVARRLGAGLDPRMVVARLGGDEFAILAPGLSTGDAAALAASIIEALSRPFSLEGLAIEVGVGVGIACLPGDAHDPESLLRQADLALAKAKSKGRSGFSFYDRELGNRALIRARLRQDLRFALDRRELEVHYQPIVDLASGRISGFEALLRWNHPVLGAVSPAVFVPIAEATGLIVQIGAWVLRVACEEAAHWPSGMRVAINLSPVQFRGQDLMQRVRAALYESRLAPSSLELEITETALLEATRPTLEVLHQLRALGVRVALDDFGTGYASLGYLVTFPFDKIKVDKSFIRDIGRRDECAAVVDAIVQLARRIGMIVTAEGVESTDQALALRRKGCDQMQGFLISQAQPSETARGMIDGWTPFGGPMLAARLRPEAGDGDVPAAAASGAREAPVP